MEHGGLSKVDVGYQAGGGEGGWEQVGVAAQEGLSLGGVRGRGLSTESWEGFSRWVGAKGREC